MEDLVRYMLWLIRLEKKKKKKEIYPNGSQKPLPSDSMDLYAMVDTIATPEKHLAESIDDILAYVYDMVTADSDTGKEASIPKIARTSSSEETHSKKLTSNHQVTATDSNKFSKKWRRILLIFLIAALALIIAACIALIVALVQISDLRSDVMLFKSTSPAHIVNGFTSMNDIILDNIMITNLTYELNVFMEQINTVVTETNNQIEQNIKNVRAILDDVVEVTTIQTFASCAEAQQLYPLFSSGYYNVRSINGSGISVYCDMTRTCGNVTGGWMRVTLLDMRYTSFQCPRGFTESTNLNIRNCIQTSSRSECSALIYPTRVMYSQVCGTVRAYQIRDPNGFLDESVVRPSFPIPSQNYLDGVSLTHGVFTKKQHIWSFAASSDCDCSTDRPSFVENDFSCDGVPAPDCPVFCDDVLWDGDGCQSNNNPWFYKQLPQSTTDDIDFMLCRDQERFYEDIAIEMIEILVQ